MATTDFIILHLSDLHITPHSAPEVIDRVPHIVSAVNARAVDSCTVLVFFSGDVAFSGQAIEYEHADKFLSQLIAEIRKIPNVASVEVALVPGNHDCDFALDTQIRQLVIESLASTNPVKVDQSVVDACTQPQDAFFAFQAKYGGSSDAFDRLRHARIFRHGDSSIRLRSINTAWVSKIRERQGELFFPYGEIETDDHSDIDITMFHHPLNWLEATNARAVRSQLDRYSQIVLTGHEHESAAHERRVISGGGSLYVEGALLHELSGGHSGFNLLAIDGAAAIVTICEYEWNGELYTPVAETRTASIPNRGASASLRVKAAYLNDFILDPGAPFTHPVKGRLSLDDIYVPPDLSERAGPEEQKSTRIPSHQADSFCREKKRLVIAGPNDCGKTALLKRVYRAALADGQLPLWLNGEDIKRSDSAHLSNVMQRAIEQQYGVADVTQRFLQARATDKVIIIDDFHRVKGNRKAHSLVVDHFCRLAERVVLSVDDIYDIERSATTGSAASLTSFSSIEIRDFGYQLRGELIDKWVRLGRELTLSDSDLAYEIQKTENAVNTLLGKSLFPPYPLFVLTVLQTIEAMTSLKTASVGTYGYVYEALITAKLSSSKQVSVDTKYNFLAYLAYAMFDAKVTSLSDERLNELNDTYFQAYRVRLPLDSLIAEFNAAGIMHKNSQGGVGFRYRYVHYYFVGRYLAEGLSDPDVEQQLRAVIDRLVSEIYREEYANVLLFLLYLSKDRRVLQSMFVNAASIYADAAPAQLESDVAFVGRLDSGKLPLQIPATDVDSRRKEERARRDQRESVEDENNDEFLSLNVAMKSIQILGQVLRNFAGSLPGALKLRIANEVSQLGLRAMTSVYALIDSRLDEIRRSVRELLEKREASEPVRVAQKADQYVFHIVVLFAHAVVKRISFAIGSEELAETYKDLLASHETTAMRMVDAAIRLDHFRHVNVPDLENLRRNVEGNSVALTLLRQLVWDRLYLFPVDFKIRQQLCKQFAIRDSPRLLDSSAKRLK